MSSPNSDAEAIRREAQRREEALAQLNEDWANCSRCALWTDRDAAGLEANLGSGSLFPHLMLIADHPTAFDMENGWGRSDADVFFFRDVFRDAGIDVDDVWFTSLSACRPMDESGRTISLPSEAINACQPRLAREISILDPTLILLVGEKAFKTLTGSTETFSSAANHLGTPLFFVRVRGETGVTVPYPAYVTHNIRDLLRAANVQVSKGRKPFAPNQKCWFAEKTAVSVGEAVRALLAHNTGKNEPEAIP